MLLGRSLDMHAVVGQAGPGRGEQIDKYQFAFGRDLGDRLHEEGQIGVVLRDIGNQRTWRFFERIDGFL